MSYTFDDVQSGMNPLHIPIFDTIGAGGRGIHQGTQGLECERFVEDIEGRVPA